MEGWGEVVEWGEAPGQRDAARSFRSGSARSACQALATHCAIRGKRSMTGDAYREVRVQAMVDGADDCGGTLGGFIEWEVDDPRVR